MKQILIVFKKDMLETLRDKRSLIVMVVVPLLLFPLIFGITTKMQGDSNKKETLRLLNIGYVAPQDDLGLGALLGNSPGMKLITVSDTAQLRQLIRQDSLDLGLALPSDFIVKIAEMQPAVISTFGAMTDDIAQARLNLVLNLFQESLRSTRLQRLQIEPSAIEPVKIQHFETALMKESMGKLVGGFLPYVFILFCYMGSMFPAIDLFTGEKERGSIETLLSAPIERWKIMIGKLMVIVVAGLTTAVLSLSGLFLSLQIVAGIPTEMLDLAYDILTPKFILALISMLLPLVVLFAGIMIPATVYAKSFKEASTILSPMNFLVITPAVIGMLPGIELNVWTAMIPVLNVVLSTKELIADTMNWGLFALVIASSLVLSSLAITISLKRFGSEKSVLRS